MFRIKICGVTRPDDALTAARAGADAIGLNFYRQSVRRVDLETAAAIVAELPREVQRVGVFVNASAEEVLTVQRELSLDYLQLHGDEPPEFLAELGALPLIRAFRIVSEQSWQEVSLYLRQCQAIGCLPAAVLMDAFVSGHYGGTGQAVEWTQLHPRPTALMNLPLILAGGLTPDNVADAVSHARPDAVDTASGVELEPGRKDPIRTRNFVAAARRALAR